MKNSGWTLASRVIFPVTLLSLSAIILSPTVSLAAVLTVTTTADTLGPCVPSSCSLRAAVNTAAHNSEEDTIVLGAGTFLLTLGAAGEDAGLEGDLDVVDDSNPIWIRGAGATNTVIDGNGNDRIFDVVNSEVNIEDLALRNGSVTGCGGAIRATGTAMLWFYTVEITGNNASASGGGICLDGSDVSLALHYSEISGNTASFGGGLSNSDGRVTIGHALITDNEASLGGGGISNSDGDGTTRFEISWSEISQNRALGCTNSTDDEGGGIRNGGSSTDMKLYRSTISDNTARRGGGISNTGTMRIENSTISGNRGALSAGCSLGGTQEGGIRAGYITNVFNSTVTDNFASSHGGIGASDHVFLYDTILAGNTAGTPANSSPSDCNTYSSGTLHVSGSNLLGAVDQFCNLMPLVGVIITDLRGTIESPLDPLLGPLADNGGQTLTHVLLPGSPAIDGGDAATCRPTDQRDLVRPVDGDGDGTAVCDIGSIEYRGLIFENGFESGDTLAWSGAVP